MTCDVSKVEGELDVPDYVERHPPNDKCSVYEVRPLEYRGYTSFDVQACHAAYDNYENWNVPMYIERYSIFKNVQAGLLMATAGSGLSHQILELNSGLNIALSQEDVADRWLAGEDVFKLAEIAVNDQSRLALEPWIPTFIKTIE